MTKKVENFIIVALTLLLIGVFGFKLLERNRINDYVDNFAILQIQLNVMEHLEGKSIFNLVADADKDYLEKTLKISPNKPKFVIVLNDSLCHPCFPNYISGYISDLRERGIEIDPTQWYGIFTSKAKNEIEMIFKSAFGPKAKTFFVNQLDPSLNPHDDAYILFLTESNAIFAASRVFKVNTEIKQYFVSRVVNYLHSKILTTN